MMLQPDDFPEMILIEMDELEKGSDILLIKGLTYAAEVLIQHKNYIYLYYQAYKYPFDKYGS